VTTCLLVTVRGKVQGVFFRASTQEQARQGQLSGYAKNLRNGDVEVLVCGEPNKVEDLLRWLHHGPPLAKVEHLSTEKQDTIVTGDFEIR